MRGICFGTQKLLNRFRNQSGEPAIQVRKVSPRCSTESIRKPFNYFELYLTDSRSDGTVIGALVRTQGICVLIPRVRGQMKLRSFLVLVFALIAGGHILFW
jgi:hypothetical protein